MKVQPLSITSVLWASFIEVAQDVVGVSPTRGLDDIHMDVKDPASFLASLDCQNQPVAALTGGKRSNLLSHMMMSFLLTAASSEQDVLIEVANRTKLATLRVAGKRKYLAVLSGTVDEWYDAILAGCSKDADEDFRKLMNEIATIVELSGFRYLFEKLEKNYLNDTFYYR